MPPMRSHNPINSFAECVVESDLDFRVDTRIYKDSAIFDEEMRRIFENTWVYVGHVSEIETPGDYKTAQIGRNPVIVTRDGQGGVHVLLNECRHRGNAVCREFYGHVENFTCPYHGWVYGLDGALKGCEAMLATARSAEQQLKESAEAMAAITGMAAEGL